MISIDALWARIRAHAGARFRQIRGKPFACPTQGAPLVPVGINQNTPRGQFEKVIQQLPLESTVPVQCLRGSSEIFAMLMERCVRGADEWGSRGS